MKAAIGLVCAAVAVIGGAGAYGTYTNASDLVGDGFAVSMVAGGEGVVAVCAMVMLLLTVLGRPAPAALRLGTVAMPVVASALGVVVADDLKTRVIMAAGPLAMTAASEGLCLIARNAVAASRGYDVEAVHRDARRAARLDEHAAKEGLLSKRVVIRTRRQIVASDPKSAELIRAALRKQVSSDVSVRMVALGAVPADVDRAAGSPRELAAGSPRELAADSPRELAADSPPNQQVTAIRPADSPDGSPDGSPREPAADSPADSGPTLLDRARQLVPLHDDNAKVVQLILDADADAKRASVTATVRKARRELNAPYA